jgi:hypothetical protein
VGGRKGVGLSDRREVVGDTALTATAVNVVLGMDASFVHASRFSRWKRFGTRQRYSPVDEFVQQMFGDKTRACITEVLQAAGSMQVGKVTVCWLGCIGVESEQSMYHSSVPKYIYDAT